MGSILLEPKISNRFAARGAVVAAAALIVFLIFGEYTRKERIGGWLVPENGIVRVMAPQTGLVASVSTKEGSHVSKGQPLLVLSTEVASTTVGETVAEVLRQLRSRASLLRNERQVQAQLGKQKLGELQSRLGALTGEASMLRKELEISKRKITLTNDTLSRARQLGKLGIITKTSLASVETDNLDMKAKFESLQREFSRLNREIEQVRTEQQNLPEEQGIKISQLDREITSVEQAIAESEARREIVITAPQAGVVTAIQAEPGGTAMTNIPLLTIVPDGSKLQAQMFAPSRSVGFIKPGDKVLLRYQPFPYQNFGFYKATVSEVSRTALNPDELPQKLAGLSTLYGANAPVFRIIADLERQDVTAYGQTMPLQPGMQLDADVLIERHRLIEWLVYPLFAKSGAWVQ